MTNMGRHYTFIFWLSIQQSWLPWWIFEPTSTHPTSAKRRAEACGEGEENSSDDDNGFEDYGALSDGNNGVDEEDYTYNLE